MKNSEIKENFSKNIVEKIRQRKITAKPRVYFVLKKLLEALTLVLFFTVAIFLVSFILFILRATGVLFLPGFGLRGLLFFLATFPWPLAFAVIFFLLVLEEYAKRYSLVWSKPIIYSFAAITLIVLLFGFFVFKTPAHAQFSAYALEKKLPLAASFYSHYGENVPPELMLGKVVQEADGSIEIESKNDLETIIVTPEKINPIFGRGLKKGDFIMIFGEKKPEGINAFGIRKAKGNEFPFLKNGAGQKPRWQKVK
ncbi:MAG: hypothetical protein ABIF89_00965 [bacterium]